MTEIRVRNLNDRYQRPYGMPRPVPAAVAGAMDRATATKPRRQRSRAGSRPNAALEALYRKRLERLVTEMAESVSYWMRAAYRQHEPVMAMDGGKRERERSGRADDGAHDAGDTDGGVRNRMAADASHASTAGRGGIRDADAEPHLGSVEGGVSDGIDIASTRRGHARPVSLHLAGDSARVISHQARESTSVGAMDARPPSAFLKAAFDRLRKRWEERFDTASGKLARWFAQSAATRSDERLRRILKDGGLSVRFTPTKAMRDVMEGTVQANVALIKSIPQQYLTQVEGYVMRSVQTGRDLHQLSNDLRRELGVTKKRAAFIAIDQNNKANASMTRVRQVELGIKQAVWVHSHAGKTPRKTHLANDGQPYDVERGWFDPDPKVKKRIFPGELPRCRCFSRSIIPGFKP